MGNIVRYYNRSYLIERVKLGNLINDEFFRFTSMDDFGVEGGFTVDYYIHTGLVVRTSAVGESFTFGDASKSSNKRGYMCVELCVPYDRFVHEYVRPEQVHFGRVQYGFNGGVTCTHLEPLSVQFTCYIHNLGSIIKDVMANKKPSIEDIANHMDGCTFHNQLSNIEPCGNHGNNLHAAMMRSMIHHGINTKTSQNKYGKFVHLDVGFTSVQLEDFIDGCDADGKDIVGGCIYRCAYDLRHLGSLMKKNQQVHWVPKYICDLFLGEITDTYGF